MSWSALRKCFWMDSSCVFQCALSGMDEFPQTHNGIRGMNLIDWLLAKD
ncbi:hypothetical protein Tam1G_2151 [Bifidobacterium imperatoris]|uniref:Uncharacterized protein n=1 Tax=Bifidobacterium imperatoris TaxID=2020965 RepID=A0A2N5IPC8_9BIFI|nr:hypothetical protein Tam1G_2151 [Bifidobacterium imperatoris]